MDGSTHSNGKILYTGTASDPYSGTWGSDIQDIWFDVTGPDGYSSHFAIDGSVAWAYDWNFEELESGEYTFEVWASDSDFCDDEQGICVVSTRTVPVLNDNIIPIVETPTMLNATHTPEPRKNKSTVIKNIVRKISVIFIQNSEN